MSFGDDILRTIDRVARALDAAGVRWAIGGSFASTIHGEPRSTNDIDFVAALASTHVRTFIGALGPDFFAVPEAIAEGVVRQSSFNVIDDETMVKVDVFVPSAGPMGLGQLTRRRRTEIVPGFAVFVLAAEDVVLQKLRWFELSGSTSDRQWRDVCGVLRLAGERMDLEYLREVARDAGMQGLLDRAIADSHRH